MDAVTHVLVGYLLGSAFFVTPASVAFCTFMAFVPDLDTIGNLFRPVRLRVPHRGPTHSLLVGALVSTGGAGLLAGLGKGAFLPLLAAGLIGFLSHVVLDILNWGCWAAWPWRSERVTWTVQQGLHGPLVASVAGFALIGAARWFAPGLEGAVTLAVGLTWAGYLGMRVLTRAYLHARFGLRVRVHPTGKPFEWRVTRDLSAEGAYGVEHHRFRVGRGAELVARSAFRLKPVALPLVNSEAAAAFALALPEVKHARAALGALHLTIEETPPDAPHYRLRWWSGWSPWRDGIYCVDVQLTPQGAHEAKIEWFPTRLIPRGIARDDATV